MTLANGEKEAELARGRIQLGTNFIELLSMLPSIVARIFLAASIFDRYALANFVRFFSLSVKLSWISTNDRWSGRLRAEVILFLFFISRVGITATTEERLALCPLRLRFSVYLSNFRTSQTSTNDFHPFFFSRFFLRLCFSLGLLASQLRRVSFHYLPSQQSGLQQPVLTS